MGHGSGGSPNYYLELVLGGSPGRAVCFAELDESSPDRLAAMASRGDADRGESWADHLCGRAVVDADDGEVIGTGEPASRMPRSRAAATSL